MPLKSVLRAAVTTSQIKKGDVKCTEGEETDSLVSNST